MAFQILRHFSEYKNEKLLVINNLSSEDTANDNPLPDDDLAIIMPRGFTFDETTNRILLEPHGFVWMRVI